MLNLDLTWFRFVTVASSFSDEHPVIYALLNALESEQTVIKNILEGLLKFDAYSSADTLITSSCVAIGNTLVTLFLIMEICTFAFNVELRQSFESSIRLGMRTIFMYIIIENIPNVLALCFTLFKSLVNSDEIIALLDANIFSYMTYYVDNIIDDFEILSGGVAGISYILFGLAIVVVIVLYAVLAGAILMQLFGIIFEQRVCVAISPIATASLVNSQARQTGIAFIKNCVAVNIQIFVLWASLTLWGELASGGVVGERVISMPYRWAQSTEGLLGFLSSLFSSSNEAAINTYNAVASVVSLINPLFWMFILSCMLKKVGDLTKRALGG